jgi:hypothetical protein
VEIGSYDWSHVIENNTVNGKKLGYFLAQSDLEIDGSQYGQIIIATCDNVTIKFGEFSNATIGVIICDSSNCRVINGSLSLTYQSIAVRESTGTQRERLRLTETPFLPGNLDLMQILFIGGILGTIVSIACLVRIRKQNV